MNAMIQTVKQILILSAIVGFLSSCGQEVQSDETESEVQVEDAEVLVEEVDTTPPDSLVARLTSDRDKIAYFKDVIFSLQKAQVSERTILQSEGYDSPNHKKAKAKIAAVNSRNFELLKAYEQKFGTPKENSVGRMQSEAIWFVVHNSPDLEPRAEYFSVIQFARNNELISDSQFALYLSRWYEMKTEDPLVLESPYTEIEQINAYMKALGVR